MATSVPALRQDLQLFEGPEALNGARTWAVYDPVRNRHFKLGAKAFALLSRWHEGSVENILNAARNMLASEIRPSDFEEVLKFVTANSLVETQHPQDVANLLAQYRAANRRDIGWYGRNMFFFRLPLLRAERLLKRLTRLAEPLYSRTFRVLLAMMAIIGVYLVARQIDTFLHSFEYFFTWQGVLLFVCSLVLLKIIHEFAHGVTATRFGARVSNMGVAFMVFFPVLYTDVSDSWRIRSRRKRLLIGAAGILVELYIAIICTFLWSFLPDGSYRSAVFFLATTSWIWTLAINVNPFMKFDGYYLLSDYWEVENLQERAFALGVWRLRELLFDLGHPIPDSLPTKRTRQLIIYAWLTWLYRSILFFTIAVFILSSFFKLAAIILLCASGYRFIGRPVIDELNAWVALRSEIMKRMRSYITLIGIIALTALMLVPWFGTVSAPAILHSEQRTVIYPERAARLVRILVEEGQSVEADELLYQLADAALAEELEIAEKRLTVIQLKLRRGAASKEERANRLILNQELAEYETKVAGLREQAAKLRITAPFAGRLVNTNRQLHEGRWIPKKFEMAQLVASSSLHLEAVLHEADLGLVRRGDQATFYPDEFELPSLAAEVADIERANLRSLHIPYLQSVFGGKVAVHQDENGNAIPESSVFRMTLKLREPATYDDRVIRGVARVDGEPSSLLSRIYRRVAAVLIRESGF